MFKKVLVSAMILGLLSPSPVEALTSSKYTSHIIECSTGEVGTATRLGRGTYLTALHVVENCGDVKNWARFNIVKFDRENDIAIITTRRDKLEANVSCDVPIDGSWLVMSGYAKEDGKHYQVMYGTANGTHNGGWNIAEMSNNKAALKGMSGGPVVDMQTDELVGIIHGRNEAATKSYIIGMDKICPLLKRVRNMKIN